LAEELEKVGSSLKECFECSSIAQATEKYLELHNMTRQAQKENTELRMQVGQLKSLRFEVAESGRRIADLRQTVDVVESRMVYLKQVVMQLLTAPFSQRQKIADLLIDLMSFSQQEKEAIMRSPSGGQDLPSRLRYAFGPFA
jgi:hypothetical protein